VPRYLRELFLGCVRQFNAHSRSVPHTGEQSRPICDSRSFSLFGSDSDRIAHCYETRL
jgi:hypothetical protein